MKSYISYFKLKFKAGLQYRAAALAGMSTQFFFGFVYILVYIACFESGGKNLPMSLKQLVGYVWLQQALFALIYPWHKDKEILDMIKNGNIAYELTRPQDLYFMWMARIYGDKLSAVTLRFLPVLITSLLLPSPYNLSIAVTLERLVLFIISLTLSSILITVIALLYHVICMITLDEKGIVNIFIMGADVFSGLIIPVAFFPKGIKLIAKILPFSYTSDFPFRLFVGNITIKEAGIGIIIQIIWILSLIVIGKLISQKALNKAVVQGG